MLSWDPLISVLLGSPHFSRHIHRPPHTTPTDSPQHTILPMFTPTPFHMDPHTFTYFVTSHLFIHAHSFLMSVYQSTIALPSSPSLKTLLRIRSIHRGIAIQSPSSRLLNQKPKMYYFPLGHPHSCAIQYPILILSTYRLSSTPLSSLVFSLSLSTTSTFCT